MLVARVIMKFFQYLLIFAVEAKSKEKLAKNVGAKKWFSLYQPKSRWRRSTHS